MRGVFLVKFDEKKGFIPVDPIFTDDENILLKKRNLLKEIARNAIGFGTQLDFNSFSLSGINCISQKFSITKNEARGGGETYALVIISNKDVMKFKTGLNTAVEKFKQDWKNVKKYLQQLFHSVKYPEQALIFKEKNETLQTTSVPIYSHKAFQQPISVSRLSKRNSLGRNLLMGIGCSIILITILMTFQYSEPFQTFDLWKYGYTNILMFFFGLLVYSIVNRKKFTQKIESLILILLFLIPIYTIITNNIIFDLVHLEIYFTGFIAGLFVCLGLDYEGKIDYVSLYILIFLILLILLFVAVFLLTVTPY
ncbi:MAG: hypothetical protein ACTSRG_03755 [Candidatus Helarchaeota archaeon]